MRESWDLSVLTAQASSAPPSASSPSLGFASLAMVKPTHARPAATTWLGFRARARARVTVTVTVSVRVRGRVTVTVTVTVTVRG